jgi:hypothetical protein
MDQRFDSSYVVTGIAIPNGLHVQFFMMKLNPSLTTTCTSIDLPTNVNPVSFSDTSIVTDTTLILTPFSIAIQPVPVSFIDSTVCDLINTMDPVPPESIRISPNPFHDVLKIDGVNSGWIIVYDLMGKMVYSSPFNGEIDLQRLANGMFILEVRSERGIIRRRILKES